MPRHAVVSPSGGVSVRGLPQQTHINGQEERGEHAVWTRRGGRYFAPPPDGATSFKDLFRFIWEMGLGNAKSGPDGPGRKWKRETLAAASDETVSLRTIDDWRSRKGVPHDPNLPALLNLITDRATRSAWAEKPVRVAANTGRPAMSRTKTKRTANGRKRLLLR